jgi:hypothetical protein
MPPSQKFPHGSSCRSFLHIPVVKNGITRKIETRLVLAPIMLLYHDLEPLNSRLVIPGIQI